MRAATTLALAAVVGCASRPKTTTGDSFVRMERLECLGRCPAYRLTLYADGVVEFHGVKEVPAGTQWGHIDPAQVTRLMARVEHAPEWTCDPARIETDQPAALMTVMRHGREVRRIMRDTGDPCAPHQDLERIEADIDITGGTATFVAHE
jgi:hypothetical protein